MRGFGINFDVVSGVFRSWYIGDDGVQRWTDSDEPVNASADAAGESGHDEARGG